MRGNLANNASRVVEAGCVFTEVKSNAAGSIEVERFHTIRVRAVAAGTVTIDGILACTLGVGEVILMNVGAGKLGDTKDTVTVTFSAAVYCQVGAEVERITL